MTEFRLSRRLQALAALVTPGLRLCDVGTDHGYIPIRLCRDGVIPSAIAMDINRGPLMRADEHIRAWNLTGRIETRLSDGLECLRPGEADSILIAGMGGALMMRILSQGTGALTGITELILQPQSEIPGVRRFLREHGFVIVKEDMVFEDGKFYPMMRAVPDAGDILPAQHTPVCDIELADAFGPELLRQKHPILVQWLTRELGITDTILQRLQEQITLSEESHKIKENATVSAGNDTDDQKPEQQKLQRLLDRKNRLEQKRRQLSEAYLLITGENT